MDRVLPLQLLIEGCRDSEVRRVAGLGSLSGSRWILPRWPKQGQCSGTKQNAETIKRQRRTRSMHQLDQCSEHPTPVLHPQSRSPLQTRRRSKHKRCCGMLLNTPPTDPSPTAAACCGMLLAVGARQPPPFGVLPALQTAQLHLSALVAGGPQGRRTCFPRPKRRKNHPRTFPTDTLSAKPTGARLSGDIRGMIS